MRQNNLSNTHYGRWSINHDQPRFDLLDTQASNLDTRFSIASRIESRLSTFICTVLYIIVFWTDLHPNTRHLSIDFGLIFIIILYTMDFGLIFIVILYTKVFRLIFIVILYTMAFGLIFILILYTMDFGLVFMFILYTLIFGLVFIWILYTLFFGLFAALVLLSPIPLS